MKNALLVLAIAVLSFGFVSVANAWTVEDCPTAETHPDCVQYFPSPSPTVEPTVTPTATPDGRGPGPEGQPAPLLPNTGYGR